MKKICHSGSCGRRVIGIALAAVFFSPQLFAQQPAPSAVPPAPPASATPAPEAQAGSLVTLPDGWKILSLTADKPNTSGTGTASPQSATLLLSATRKGATHDITLSLYSTCFSQNIPSLSTGESGIEAESAEFMQMVLMQGYAPSSVTIERINVRGRDLITLDITAKNGAGEERIFTDTAIVNPVPNSNSYHLYTSRSSDDAAAANEFQAILKTLNTPAPVAGIAPGSAMPANPNGLQPALPGTQPPAAPLGPQTAPDTSNPSVLAQTGPASTQAAQIVQDYHSALVMVEGSKGVGSGFLCKMDGHTYVVTNAHVLADNAGVKLTSLDGAAFTSGSSAVAVGHDIVKMEVPAAPKTFEVMANLDSAAKIGDAVMIPGNAEGAQVVRPVEGKIVGIGPNLVEVDAPFVRGNSGSPIVHEATGKVLGVATYLMQRKVDKDAAGQVVVETRRFGYRIDSVKQWQPINWQIFFAESAQVAAIEELSEDFISLFKDGNHLSTDNVKNAALARVVRTFLESADRLRTNGSRADKQELLRGFFADLRATAHGDITTFNSRPAYDYFRRDVEEQARFRDEVYDTFTRAMQSASP